MSSLTTRPLGASGLKTSIVGLGCNNFGRRADLAATRAVIDTALEEGVTFLDTADIYGRGQSEEYLGEVLQGRRDDVVLATKFGMDMGDGRGPRGSRDYILHCIDASLTRLRTDTIDYYWYHQPDGVTPIAETLGALDELVRAGKVRYIGASNFEAWRTVDAEWSARSAHRARFISAQNRYNLLERDVERELVPAALRCGVGILPWFPLAAGVLTGKYRRGEEPAPGTRLAGSQLAGSMLTDHAFTVVERLEAFAGACGHSMLEVAIAGLASRPAVGSVIAGATSPEQVRANAQAGDWELSAEEREALEAALASQ